MRRFLAFSVALTFIVTAVVGGAVAASRIDAWANQRHAAPISDGEIHDQVLIKLASDPDVKGTGIDVEVKDRVVTLKGKVQTEKIRAKAGRLAKRVRGGRGYGGSSCADTSFLRSICLLVLLNGF